MIIQFKIQWNVIAYIWIQKKKWKFIIIVDECGGISCALLTGKVLRISKNIQPHNSISAMINLNSCCFLRQEYSGYYSIERNYCVSIRNDHHCKLKYWIIYIFFFQVRIILSWMSCVRHFQHNCCSHIMING